MSVGQTTRNASNYLTAAAPAWGSLTLAGWFQAKDISSTAYSTWFAVMDNASSYSWLGTDFADNNLKIWNSTSGFSTGLGTLAADDWVYLAMVHNGATATAYMSKNNASSVVASIALPSRTSTGIQAFLDLPANANSIGAYLGYARIWNVALTQSQLDAERNSAAAIVTSGLVSDSPLPTTSSLGAWTVVGSLSSGADSPFINVPLSPITACFPIGYYE